MHTGNRCSKTTRAKVSEVKKNSVVLILQGMTEFCIILQLWYTNSFRWKDESYSPNFLFVNGESKRMLSCFATRRVCGTTFFEQLLKPGEYEILSSVDRGRKKYKLRILFCSANLGCTHKRTECHEWFRQFWRSVSQRRLPRETESTCKRSFTPSNVDSRRMRQQWTRNERTL